MSSNPRKRESDVRIDDGVPRSKKAKTPASTKVDTRHPDQTHSAKIDSNGDKYWELSKMRRVTVSSFRGKAMVNIREYYEKDGQELPGKKGISLPIDQFSSLLNSLPGIETALKEYGEFVPRPLYDDGGNRPDETDGFQDDEPQSSRRTNIEATSEEDESEE